MKKKKRKINKNLFNKWKNNKYQINPEKKLVIKNDLFSTNDKCDYLSKKIFTKNIFSSLNKKETPKKSTSKKTATKKTTEKKEEKEEPKAETKKPAKEPVAENKSDKTRTYIYK